MRRFAAALLIACLAALPAAAQNIQRTQKAQFVIETVTRGLENPWGMAFLPDGGVLITERPGRLRMVKEGVLSDPIDDLPDIAEHGQGGLLDVALHPNFAENRLIYLSYAAEGRGGYGTGLARARLAEDGAELDDVEILFDMESKTRGGRHFGSRLAFDREGYLYLTIGDRGERDRAQQTGDPAGSVLQFNADGGVPADNPFVTVQGALPQLYSYGHRNPQGMALNPFTGDIWVNEHGPRGGDEINIVKPRVNYGWPLITYGEEYSGGPVGAGLTNAPGLAQPLYYWTPSIAPSGMAFYDADAFPKWQGSVLVGSLKFQLLVRLEIRDGTVVHEERMIQREIGRIRDVAIGPDGLVYLLTDEPDGGLYRLRPTR